MIPTLTPDQLLLTQLVAIVLPVLIFIAFLFTLASARRLKRERNELRDKVKACEKELLEEIALNQLKSSKIELLEAGFEKFRRDYELTDIKL